MESIHLLHIPKTGGTALKQAFRDKRLKPDYLILNGHAMTFRDVVEAPSARCIIFVRDIATRFVSGFNSRLRMGRPYTDARWDEGEQVAFRRFPTANDLAESLSSPCLVTRRAAECAMASIWHTRFPLHFWLHSSQYLELHKRRILFIGRQERLETDFRRILSLLGIDEDLRLPSDDVLSHKTPKGYCKLLSEAGEDNIRTWYQDDADILDWCDKFADLGHYSDTTNDR